MSTGDQSPARAVPRRLEGKVAIITGAAGGIGAATARRFAAEGAFLALSDADGSGARRLADGLGSRAVSCPHDVTREDDWRAVRELALERHGRIDILFNNAAIGWVDAGKRDTPRPGWHGGRYTSMREVPATDHGGGLYRRRKAMVEPLFAQTKHNRRIDSVRRRGRSAVRSECG